MSRKTKSSNTEFAKDFHNDLAKLFKYNSSNTSHSIYLSIGIIEIFENKDFQNNIFESNDPDLKYFIKNFMSVLKKNEVFKNTEYIHMFENVVKSSKKSLIEFCDKWYSIYSENKEIFISDICTRFTTQIDKGSGTNAKSKKGGEGIGNSTWTDIEIGRFMIDAIKPYIFKYLVNKDKDKYNVNYKNNKINKNDNETDKNIKPFKILDGCVGTNNLFISCEKYLKNTLQNYKIQYYANELNAKIKLLSQTHNKINNLNINYYNTNSQDDFMEIDISEILKKYGPFDLAIMNPPFSIKELTGTSTVSHNAIEFSIQAMKLSKFGVFIYPESQFTNDKLLDFRSQLFKLCYIPKIFRMGSNIFKTMGTGNIMIFVCVNKYFIENNNLKEYIKILNNILNDGLEIDEYNNDDIKEFDDLRLIHIYKEYSIKSDNIFNYGTKKYHITTNENEYLKLMDRIKNLGDTVLIQNKILGVRNLNEDELIKNKIYKDVIFDSEKDVLIKIISKYKTSKTFKFVYDYVKDFTYNLDDFKKNKKDKDKNLIRFKDIELIDLLNYSNKPIYNIVKRFWLIVGAISIADEYYIDKWDNLINKYDFENKDLNENDLNKFCDDSKIFENNIYNEWNTVVANLLNYLNPKNICRIIKIKLSDVFEIVNGPSHYTNEGFDKENYPLVCASKSNNGILKYMKKYDFDKNLYTLVKDGDSQGYIFKQTKKFCKVPTVIVLNKIIKMNDINLNLISLQLNTIFNWSNKLSLEKYNNNYIYIYI